MLKNLRISSLLFLLSYVPTESVEFELLSHGGVSCIKFNTVHTHTQYWDQLRQDYKLDELVVDCKSDLDRAMTVMHWVSTLWKHNGDNVPTQSDPLYLLDQVINHHQNFRCVEYAKVTRGCLIALGLPCRILGLKTEDCQTRDYGAGHVVCELYLKDLNKWIMLDPQFDVVPFLDDVPLNAVEFMHALDIKSSQIQLLSLDKERLAGLGYSWNDISVQYYNFIGQYLFYFDTPVNLYDLYEQTTGLGVMLVPVSAPNPVVFQNTRSLDYLMYTHCVSCFYPVLHT